MDIHKRYFVPAPVARVFAAWTSSDTVIPPASRMAVDPVPGGRYQLFMDGPDGGMSALGMFHTVQHNARLIYSWEWNGDGDVSLIDVSFRAAQDNAESGTEIDLSHRGFLTQTSADMHDSGWYSYVTGLISFLQDS